jgi:hypothetical protein
MMTKAQPRKEVAGMARTRCAGGLCFSPSATCWQLIQISMAPAVAHAHVFCCPDTQLQKVPETLLCVLLLTGGSCTA